MKLYSLFRDCFPQVIRCDDTIQAVLSDPENTVFRHEVEGSLVGAAVTNGNHVVMLAVLPAYRGRGIGSRLLSQAECHIRALGYDSVLFTPGKEYLTPGIPVEFPPYEANRAFFVKRGYFHNWGDCSCVDMSLSFDDAALNAVLGVCIGDTLPAVSKKGPASDPDAPENQMTYRFAVPDEMAAVVDCVLDAEKNFAKYYKRPVLYMETAQERTLIAVNASGHVCGALLVSVGGEAPTVGSVGCTAVRRQYQGRGIATNLVKAGTAYLRSQGMKTGFLGYTYTDIIPMYERAGYRVSMQYFMGEKKL